MKIKDFKHHKIPRVYIKENKKQKNKKILFKKKLSNQITNNIKIILLIINRKQII